MFIVCDCTGLDRADVYAKYGRCCKELKQMAEMQQIANLTSMTCDMLKKTGGNIGEFLDGMDKINSEPH